MVLRMQVSKPMRTRSVQTQAVMTHRTLPCPYLAETADQMPLAFVLLRMDCSAGQDRMSGQMRIHHHPAQTACRILLRLQVVMADQSRLLPGQEKTLHRKLMAVLMVDRMLRVLRRYSLQRLKACQIHLPAGFVPAHSGEGSCCSESAPRHCGSGVGSARPGQIALRLPGHS